MSKLVKYVFGDQTALAFYEWDVKRQGAGQRDEDVVEWDRLDPLPLLVQRQFRGDGHFLSAWRMARLRHRGLIRLFSCMVDGHPACFGVMQGWSLHRRYCMWLRSPGWVLGPFWTEPEYRGRGLYVRLLRHIVHICATEGIERMYIWAAPRNVPSRKGIERAGFQPRGCVCLHRLCCRLISRMRALEDEPATVL